MSARGGEADLRRFRDAIDQTTDGIFMVEPDSGIILDCNRSAERNIGGTREQVVGRHLADFDAELLQGTPWAALLAQIRRHGSLTAETMCRRLDGSTYPVEVTARYVPAEAGDYVVGVTRDITERRHAEARIRTLYADLERRVALRTAQLEAANKDLEGFSYSVSHDLRAPLRAIDTFSGYLLEDHAGQLDDEGRRLLGVIRRNAGRMSQLIDDVLAFSRAGKSAFNDGAVDMDELADEVFRDLQAVEPVAVAFTARGLPPGWGDRAMLRQVLANLLANALKFTQGCARPRIELSGCVQGAENVYAIRDNGVGFDCRYAHKLFGVFQRLHGEKQFKGTGIGLAIVKRIVSRHGGRVWAECNAEGPGATFAFSLPQHSGDAMAGPVS